MHFAQFRLTLSISKNIIYQHLWAHREIVFGLIFTERQMLTTFCLIIRLASLRDFYILKAQEKQYSDGD